MNLKEAFNFDIEENKKELINEETKKNWKKVLGFTTFGFGLAYLANKF